MRLYPSHPFYKIINDLSESYARIVNKHMWFNLKDIPLEYQLQAQEEIYAQLEGFLSELSGDESWENYLKFLGK